MVSPVSGRSSPNYQVDTPAPSSEEKAAIWQAKMALGRSTFDANQARSDEASKEFLKEPEKDEDDPDSQPI